MCKEVQGELVSILKMRDEAIVCSVQVKADIALDGTMTGYEGNNLR
jgi:hypothetical protein